MAGENLLDLVAQHQRQRADAAGEVEAFGDPVEYARSLGLPAEPEQSRTATLKGVVPTLIQLFGLVAVVAAMPWGPDAVGVTTTLLAGLVVAALLPVVVVALGDRVLRAIVERPVVVFLATMLILAAVAAGLIAAGRLGLDQGLFELPRPLMLVIGLLALALGTWVNLRVNGQWERTQLSWIGSHGNLFLFTSASGRTQSMTLRLLDRLLQQGALQVLAEQTVVENALNAVAQTAMQNSVESRH